VRVIGITGWSGAGKTTLLARLIPELIARGLSVSTMKHAHHAFDVDTPGKDSHTHRIAGATEVLIASRKRFALMHELRGAPEPDLATLLRKLAPVDLVLIEGFKRESHRKIEIYRAANDKTPLHPDDPQVRAIASDTPFPQADAPVIPLDDVPAIADMVIAHAEPVDALLARLETALIEPVR
jgi:molybdopterin-guanine dinucleotide biosynthesis protein B